MVSQLVKTNDCLKIESVLTVKTGWFSSRDIRFVGEVRVTAIDAEKQMAEVTIHMSAE